MEWHKGQINAHELPDGTFISTDLQRVRLRALRENATYREAIEKAMKMTGSVDKLLVMSRGSEKTLVPGHFLNKQNQKAEQITKGKRNEKSSLVLPAA